MAEAAPKIDQKRLAKITALAHGSHNANSKKMCAMEAVAFVAGEPWSDHPQCASPVIGAFMRAWNDGLPDDERTALLLPLIPKLVGTRGSAALESRRATMVADWFVREYTPAWLRLAALTAHADALANFPEITDFGRRIGAARRIERGRVLLAGAELGRRISAGCSVYRSPVRRVCPELIGRCARPWRRSRAGDALKPTKTVLQASAVRLVERMIEAADEPKAEAA
jgi:hypothetical protein